LSDETAEAEVTGPEGPVTLPAPERPTIGEVGEISDSPLRPILWNRFNVLGNRKAWARACRYKRKIADFIDLTDAP
jgi:hypothetical protein